MLRQEVDNLLSPGKYVHVFMQYGYAIVGADWEREELLDLADKYGAKLAGKIANSVNHGICICGRIPLFCETEQKDKSVKP